MNTLLMLLVQALRQHRWLCLMAAQWGAAQALYTVSFTSLALVMTILVRYRH